MRGFTLIEMLVVVGIIVILTTLMMVSMPGMLSSAGQSQCVQVVESALITAQANSEMYRTRCGIRIERAYRVDGDGFMKKDVNGNALWLDHQQIKFVVLGLRQTGSFAYNNEERIDESILLRRLQGSSVTELPKNFWVASDIAMASTSDDVVQSPNSSQYSVFDNCYVIFDYMGKLHQFSDHMSYMDEDQPYGGRIPVVAYPDPSAKSLLVYNREEYKSVGKKVAAIPINISLIGTVPQHN